ncbi:hypothetical protein [Stygiolobus caldivivus]|uniref:Uncharacterized protein n=1 Tax=Stygiolobus caldivivus TaxID=2824673 RepID=A0A8D5ZJW3_9CREN|nr:hypothetical protein [Stygiolobus caldivivus]BCU71071.1 hypothetical protein KN1_23680 [Stygiolobus caldivivus]
MLSDFRIIDNRFVELLLEEYFLDNNSVVNDFFIVKVAEDERRKVYRFKVWLFRPVDNKIDGFTGYLFFYKSKIVIKLPVVKDVVIDEKLIDKVVNMYKKIYFMRKPYEQESL